MYLRVLTESKSRLARIALVPSEVIPQWKEDLEKVHGDGVSELWTIAFVVNVDRLFGADQWHEKESSLLRDRLRKLPADAVKSLAAAQNVGKVDAAVLLIQNDPFFASDGFASDVFARSFATLNAEIAEMTKSK